MDQTPISYEFLQGQCYDFKGAKTIWIKTHRSGWDKRQAILIVYVSADGVNRCNLLLIFQGQDVVKNSRIKKEMQQYDSGVVVQWNSKAYCNTKVMIRWLKQLYKFATTVKPSYNDFGYNDNRSTTIGWRNPAILGAK